MITLTRYPKENRVLLNANPCLIKATTTNGSTHYFRVSITVNDSEVIEESWSKLDNELQVDLRNFYKNRFADLLPSFDLDGFQKLSNLIVKIDVTIKEYLLADDTLVESVDIPTFYMLQGFTPDDFDDTQKFQFINGVLTSQRVANNAMLTFGFYLGTDSDLEYNLEDALGTVLKTESVSDASSGLYIAQLDLTGLELTSTNYLKIGDGVSNFTQLILKPVDRSIYEASHLYFKNNNGAFITASLFGQAEVSYPHTKEEYQLSDESFKTFSVKTETSIKVNTGHLYKEQLPLIKTINESLEVFLFFEGVYKKVQVTSKKSPGQVSGEFLYNDTIEFTFQNNTPFNNDSKFTEV